MTGTPGGRPRRRVKVTPAPIASLRHRYVVQGNLFAVTFALTLIGIVAGLWTAIGGYDDATTIFTGMVIAVLCTTAGVIGILGYASAQEALDLLDLAEDPQAPRRKAVAENVWLLHARTGRDLPFVELFTPGEEVVYVSVPESQRHLFDQPTEVVVIGTPRPGGWVLLTVHGVTVAAISPQSATVAPSGTV